MSDIDEKRWTAEWQAASQKIRQLQEECGKYEGSDTFFYGVLDAFHQFGQEQFNLFKNGFNNNGGYQLEKSMMYPPEHVLRMTIDQIGQDIAVYRRVWRDRYYGSGEEKATLNEVDWLAIQALEAVTERDGNEGLIKPTQALSYFQKATRVRVIPYANAAFIGVPNTTVTIKDSYARENKRALLATAHEVGHHVYWHGMVNGKRLHIALKQYLPDQPSWALGWLEELFADVYGALVGGEMIALSSQQMMLDNFPAALTHDDGHYPIGALRPMIYIDTLRLANESITKDSDEEPLYLDETLNKLGELWKFKLVERRRPTQFRPLHPDDRINETYVTLERGREWLREAIKVIINDFLKPYLVRLYTAWDIPPQGTTPQGTKGGLESFGEQRTRAKVLQQELSEALLYERFDTLVKAINDRGLYKQMPDTPFSKPSNSWRNQIIRTTSPTELQASTEWLNIPANAWVNIFHDNSWVDAGPESEPEVI